MNTFKLTKSLVILCTSSVTLLIIRMISFQTFNYWYLCWNLLLGLIPLVLALILTNQLTKRPWVSLPMLVLTAAYVGFLPNSFYIATDFIHVQYASNQTIVFDIVMILLFTLAGLLAGLASVYLVHKELIKRLGPTKPAWIIGGLLLACSFALYLGRFLHWNTWDVLANPAGIIFDVSDRVTRPLSSHQLVSSTLLFFIMLSSVYSAFWIFVAPNKRRD